MVKLMTAIYKRPDWSDEDFFRYWQTTHAAIVSRLPGLRRYVINVAQPRADRPEREMTVYGFAELWFDDLETAAAAIASVEGRAARDDMSNFSDTTRNEATFVEEVVIVGEASVTA